MGKIRIPANTVDESLLSFEVQVELALFLHHFPHRQFSRLLRNMTLCSTEAQVEDVSDYAEELLASLEFLFRALVKAEDNWKEGDSRRSLNSCLGRGPEEKSTIVNLISYHKVETVYNIQNNNDNTSNPSQHNQPNLNPIDMIIEVSKKGDHLMAENRMLYEALLQAERDKNALLTELLKDRR